jgi:hypothetical protein
MLNQGMAHFYDCNQDPFLCLDITTPAQARKQKRIYPSVTTVLGLIKDPFLDSIYRPRMITDLARQYPNHPWQELSKLCYGTREHPVTGDTIYSSDFGTAVHKEIEDLLQHDYLDPGQEPRVETPWTTWAEPFLDWVHEEGIQPIATEHLVKCNRVKTAGSIDFIGKDSDGLVFLADYKCRSNTNGKAKTYPKDCYQLAIEADIIRRQHSLDYLPECRSVVIDCDTKEHFHKVWTPEECSTGIQVFKSTAKVYWLTRM